MPAVRSMSQNVSARSGLYPHCRSHIAGSSRIAMPRTCEARFGRDPFGTSSVYLRLFTTSLSRAARIAGFHPMRSSRAFRQ